MNNRNLIYILAFFGVLALFAETSLVNFPFVFFLGATLLVMMKKVRLYILVFILAFVCDALRVSGFGLTPLFLAGLLSVIFIYERYSGSNDVIVAGIIIALFGFFYTRLLMYSVPLVVGFYIVTIIAFVVISQLRANKKIYI